MAQPSTLSFEPAIQTVSTGDTVAVAIQVSGRDTPIVSADVWIRFDPSLLTVASPESQNVKKGPLFEHVDAKLISPGSLYVYAINSTNTPRSNIEGTVATVEFKALKSGRAEIRFDCSPAEKQTSQLITTDSTLSNVIDCTATKTHTSTVTIGSSQNVLGAATSRSPGFSMITAAFAGILLFTTLFLIYRYKHLAVKANNS